MCDAVASTSLRHLQCISTRDERLPALLTDEIFSNVQVLHYEGDERCLFAAMGRCLRLPRALCFRRMSDKHLDWCAAHTAIECLGDFEFREDFCFRRKEIEAR